MRSVISFIKDDWRWIVLCIIAMIGAAFLNNAWRQHETEAVRQGIDQSIVITSELEPPYIILPNGAHSHQIQRGHAFFVHFYRHRTALCSYTFNTVLVQVDGPFGEVVSDNHTWSDIGVTPVAERLFVSPEMPLGAYDLRRKTVSRCVGKPNEQFGMSFDFPVEVVDHEPQPD